MTGPPVRVGTTWTFDLRQPPSEMPPLPQVTFRQTEAGSTELLSQGLDESLLIEFDKRLLGGRRCYTVWAGDKLAGYGWVSFDAEDVGELGIRLQLQPCEAYIWDCYTFPEFRNMHIYSALLVWILHALHQEGLCQAWIGADTDNVPSQRGIDRAGFTRVADLLTTEEDDQRIMWLEGYPGITERVLNEARRVFLQNFEVYRVTKP